MISYILSPHSFIFCSLWQCLQLFFQQIGFEHIDNNIRLVIVFMALYSEVKLLVRHPTSRAVG